MKDQTRRTWLRESSVWGLSLLFHAALIAVLAGIVITVRVEPEAEVVLELEAAPREARAARADAAEDAAGGGAPSLSEISEFVRSEATAAPMPAAPIPATIGAPAASAAATITADPAATDPAFAVLAELAAEAAANRATGQGANPLLAGTSPGFQQLVGGIGGQGLDVVIVIDATESMDPYIGQAKKRIRDVIGVVTGVLTVGDAPPDNVRFGVVAYKDYGDDYGLAATKALPLTGDFTAVNAFIDQIFVSGGGDVPEPIHEALDRATDRRMGWRKRSRNVIVLVGDAPVHSSGRKSAVASARAFAKKYGGTINAIDVGQERRSILADFGNIAAAGEGSAFRLDDAEAFWRYLVVSIFGEKFERDVQQIVERYAEGQ